MELAPDVPLAPLTTIALGGRARFLAHCRSVADIRDALRFAAARRLPWFVLGGGSNSIFADNGYPGVVIKIELRGVTFGARRGRTVDVTAAAGEPWDMFVASTVERSFAGLECLSGIPGLVGATPIQNVGAYGQEVSQTITQLTALTVDSGHERTFTNRDCTFSYRHSRFKGSDTRCYIITAVTFRLKVNGAPTITYPQVHHVFPDQSILNALPAGAPQLLAVRAAVLALRRRKSMVIDGSDPNSRSCGSFFVNPALTGAALKALTERHRAAGGSGDVPTFIDGSDGVTRVPAAWLLAAAGWPKGWQRQGVGISQNHNLALINIAGTTTRLLALARAIEASVHKKFGITLEREPVVVEATVAR